MGKRIATLEYPSGQHLELCHGDLTEETVDAIVNAANVHLQHAAGVAGAIARKGGPAIQTESNAWVMQHGAVPHHQPAFTSAGDLPCRFIIHAVGPVWGSGDEDRKLADAIHGCLARAEELELTSIAFPPISAGIFGFPVPRAAGVFLDTFQKYFGAHPESPLKLVRLTIIDEATLTPFRKAFEACTPGTA